MRRSLRLDVAGYRLFGTLHDRDRSPELPNRPKAQRVGILLLSFGQQPRSWVGDLGSSIADRLEIMGYPVFRFDMPGLGDSPGDLPVHLEELWREIALGLHERPLLALCDELVRLFSLQGLVIGGFCGGAVTALYAANARSPLLLGLVLLEPDVTVAQTGSPTPTGGSSRLPVSVFLDQLGFFWERIRSPYAWRRFLTGEADVEFWYRFCCNVLSYAQRKLAAIGGRKKPLPEEANHRLLQAWQSVRRLRIPTLVVSDGSLKRRTYYRAFGLESGVSEPKAALRWVEIPNTTHAMLAGGAKETVGFHVESWIAEHFPCLESSR